LAAVAAVQAQEIQDYNYAWSAEFVGKFLWFGEPS
jgi:hypothetical protein